MASDGIIARLLPLDIKTPSKRLIVLLRSFNLQNTFHWFQISLQSPRVTEEDFRKQWASNDPSVISGVRGFYRGGTHGHRPLEVKLNLFFDQINVKNQRELLIAITSHGFYESGNFRDKVTVQLDGKDVMVDLDWDPEFFWFGNKGKHTPTTDPQVSQLTYDGLRNRMLEHLKDKPEQYLKKFRMTILCGQCYGAAFATALERAMDQDNTTGWPISRSQIKVFGLSWGKTVRRSLAVGHDYFPEQLAAWFGIRQAGHEKDWVPLQMRLEEAIVDSYCNKLSSELGFKAFVGVPDEDCEPLGNEYTSVIGEKFRESVKEVGAGYDVLRFKTVH